MKNIEQIIADAGITLTDEQKTAINKAVAENYKTVSDYDKQSTKLATAEEKVKTLTDSLDKFKGKDVDELEKTIAGLKTDIANKDKEYETKVADMAFNSILDTAIATAKGKDADIIKKNLDIDTLKASKNQSEDIKKALETMAGNEIYSNFFEKEPSKPLGRVNVPGKVGAGSNSNPSDYLDTKYKDNPYYQ